MPNLQCRPPVLNAMMSIFSAGMRIGALPELHDMLLALRTWQPDSPLADVCEARMMINQTEWREAAGLLRVVTNRHANLPIVSALLALCLFMLHDDEWRQVATEAIASANDTAIAVVARFLNVGSEDSVPSHGTDLSTRVLNVINTGHSLEMSR
ncbi:HrpB1 family type III secretion system apparatus protein [Burkholderia metallica]|uniref:HrpB1 family type III secretion system apparatus protein n=1 Tax=Burkholderia metallica TaxID=488729 RepID=UPI001CF56AAF|nr:HrpB1 family type III secretion system apparatus protein [Burkholderia metallica]MCA8003494.1 HrpB1 family type III secretion system apparatus protein [Burkholderia metallica]